MKAATDLATAGLQDTTPKTESSRNVNVAGWSAPNGDNDSGKIDVEKPGA